MSDLALASLHSAGFTHKDLKRIFETTENYQDIFDSLSEGNDIPTPWISMERKTKILENLKKLDQSKIKKIIEEKNISLITIKHPLYPEKLRTIKQSPYLLYARGSLREERKMIGIVGSRRSTSYGKKVLESLIEDLVRAQCGIVSGGAYGIDSISHELTLAHGGYTISVFGCGVDVFYPSQNTSLFENILKNHGALVSIFPIGTKPEPYFFPVRNEVVAALSDGILIPEAGIKSGTLITANLALEHGRDVFAIPGDIFRETSAGANRLIAQGEAKCVQNVTDILEEYFPNTPPTSLSLFEKKTWESREQETIYNSIQEGYNTPDSIGENTGFDIGDITITLSLLEIEGHIRITKGGKYEVI